MTTCQMKKMKLFIYHAVRYMYLDVLYFYVPFQHSVSIISNYYRSSTSEHLLDYDKGRNEWLNEDSKKADAIGKQTNNN